MSMKIIAYRETGAELQRMRDVRYACVAAEIATPPEVEEYIEKNGPSSAEAEVDITDYLKEESVEFWHVVEIDVRRLPKDVARIKIVRTF